LSIDDGGRIELEIVGHFDESLFPFNDDNNSSRISRIIGHVEKDGLVTLEDCFYTTKNFSFGGISKSKVLVHKVLSGAAWDKNETVTFNTFSFSVDCLDEWVGISGINVDYDLDSRTATISYKPPETISIVLDNGMKLEICFAYTLPGFPNLTEAKITQQAYFRLESEGLRDMSDFTSIVFKITNLMCFAMDEIVTIKNVFATSTEILHDGGNDKTCPVPISIYYQSIPFSEKSPKKSWHEMLFNFGAIKTNTQQVFNNWLNAYEDLSPALGLYFSTKAGAQRYLDGKFLALVQGLETYHRRTSSETLMDQESFEFLVEKILKGCPDEHLDWLKDRLMNGNEINLNKRIKKIIEPFKAHLGTNGERSKLLRKIVNTRNYLTHYNESLHVQSAKSRDLLVLCMKMEAIFNLHFLKVVGFTDEEINGVVENCHPLKQKLKET
jgi:ApeA N-terminal domain 1